MYGRAVTRVTQLLVGERTFRANPDRSEVVQGHLDVGSFCHGGVPLHALAHDFGALRAAWSFASSSCESDVLRILPPVPFNSSSILSGVAFLTRTNSVELPGFIVSASSFIKLSLMPTSVRAPETAPAVAPTARPRSGFKKISPTSVPQKPPLTAPAVVKFTA